MRSIVPLSGAEESTPDWPLQSVGPLLPSVHSLGAFSTTNAHRRHAMRYYITVLTQHVSVSEQFNSFLSGRWHVFDDDRR